MKKNRPVEPPLVPRRRLGVVVVDPLPVVRAGISRLIAEQSDLEVLAEAGAAEEGLEALDRIRRSRIVVLTGLGLGGSQDAWWFIRAVRERHPSHAIIACGANADPSMISRALFVGADGFIDKNVDPEVFVASIRKAADREIVLAGPASSAVGEIANGIEQRREAETRLTEREREVLVVAAEGLTAREIARQLGVRERTITTHLARIYGKLGVGGRVAAIRVAVQSGLVSVRGSSE